MTAQLDLAQFRARYPEFSGESDARIEAQWDVATCYMSPEDGRTIHGNSLQLSLELLTAHGLKVSNASASGAISGAVVSAGEDGVSVSVATPPIRDMFQSWLAQSDYGKQLISLLTIKGKAAPMVGGSGVVGSIRNYCGRTYR